MSIVRLKTRQGMSWTDVFPETTLTQITDLGNLAKSLLEKTFSDVAEDSILVVRNNSVDSIPLNEFVDEVGGAHFEHEHVSNDITDLASKLANYADLDGGVIISTQLPSWVIGGLKFRNTITGSTLALSDDYRKDTMLIDTENVGTINEGKFYSGYYFVVDNVSLTITVSGKNKIIGEEGTSPITSGTIVLEKGDWLVFRGIEGVSPSQKYVFDIVNNTYQESTTTAYGTVRLSDATSRGGLSEAGSNSNKVINEATAKKILKEIYYVTQAELDAIESQVKPGDLALVKQ